MSATWYMSGPCTRVTCLVQSSLQDNRPKLQVMALTSETMVVSEGRPTTVLQLNWVGGVGKIVAYLTLHHVPALFHASCTL